MRILRKKHLEEAKCMNLYGKKESHYPNLKV